MQLLEDEQQKQQLPPRNSTLAIHIAWCLQYSH